MSSLMSPTFEDALQSQARVIMALMMRETRSRFGKLRLGYLWAFVEPLTHIAILASVFAVLGRSALLGDSIVLFLATGIAPFLLANRCLGFCMNAIQGNAALLTFPMITPMDCIVARFLLEILTMTLVITVLYAGLWLSGELETAPALLMLVGGFAAAALFGGAVGGLAAVLISLAPTVERLLPVLRRPLYFVSGIFFIPAIVPEPAREILLWNPLMHAIDWVRAATYDAYRAPHLDRRFLATSLLILVFLALALERAVRTPWRS